MLQAITSGPLALKDLYKQARQQNILHTLNWNNLKSVRRKQFRGNPGTSAKSEENCHKSVMAETSVLLTGRWSGTDAAVKLDELQNLSKMEQPHFHFVLSKWGGMWWRREKNFLCIFIRDLVCVEPCPTPWTWAAWLVFSEFIKTQSLVYGNMGILDGGEAEFSPLVNLHRKKKKNPSPKPEGHSVLTLLLIWWIRDAEPQQRRGLVLRSLFVYALLFPASRNVHQLCLRNRTACEADFCLGCTQRQSPTVHQLHAVKVFPM